MFGIGSETIRESIGTALLPAKTFDIEVVHDVYWIIAEWTGNEPRIVVRPQSDGLADPSVFDREIPLERVKELGTVERSGLLILHGAEGPNREVVSVSFQRYAPLRVAAEHDPSLADRIIEHLEAEGRARVVWRRNLPAIPIVAAVLVTVLGTLALVVESPPLATVLFVASVLGVVWAAAIWAALTVRQQTRWAYEGARFREASRADFRERLTNARANALVALISTPLGAVVGWLLNVWTGS